MQMALVLTVQVLDQRILPNYSYRDDGMLLYKAIESYISKIVRHYYGKVLTDISAKERFGKIWLCKVM